MRRMGDDVKVIIIIIIIIIKTAASELYRPSDSHLSAKLPPTFADGAVSISQRGGSPAAVKNDVKSITSIKTKRNSLYLKYTPVYKGYIYSYPRNIPWRPIRLWDVKNSTLSRHGGKVVSPTHQSQSILQKQEFSAFGTNFCYRLSTPQGLVRNERLCKLNVYSLQRAPNPRTSGWYNAALSSTLQSSSMCACVCVCVCVCVC
jgi:hypothetical protein